MKIAPQFFSLNCNLAFHSLCMVHLQAIASHLPDAPIMVYDTGRWAHFHVKLHFFHLSPSAESTSCLRYFGDHGLTLV